MPWPRSLTPDIGDQVVRQLSRLNDNLERFLEHIGAAAVPSKEAVELAERRTYVGEPISEIEAALREHAELTGKEYKAFNEEE